ncbi:TPA: EamA family transporter [Klebsiella pneumoniae]|nr:EamA family transporter [Klebsiella pneumoniae]
MTLTVFCILLFAALLHASWNAIVKASGDKMYAAIGVSGSAALIALVMLPFAPQPALVSAPYLLAGSALGYTLWTFFMNGFCLLCWAMVARRREASRYLRQHWKKGILGGIGTMGSYGLALWAMTQAPLAVVAALRETSILFGALIAFIVLKEQLMPLRIVAACGIAAGAILLRLA